MSDEVKKTVNKITPKWYRKMKFWSVVMLVITPLAAGGEAAIYITQAHPAFHGVVVVAGIVMAILKGTIQDADGDGYVD